MRSASMEPPSNHDPNLIQASAHRSHTFITDDAVHSGIVIAEQMVALALKVARQKLLLRRGSVVLVDTGEELLRRKGGKALAASFL